MNRRTGTALLVLATCLGVQSAVAQVKEGRSRASFGLVGGLNLATWSQGNLPAGETAEPLENRTGFHGGLAASIPLGTSLFIQPQALFSMKGTRMSESVFESVVTVEMKLDYLEVPLFLGLRIPMRGSGIRPYIMAGPYIGIKMGCKLRASADGTSEEVDCDDPDVEGDVKSTDFGLAFGAGVEVPMGSALLSLGARYTLGLSGLNANASAGDPTVRNRVISFGVGYFFRR
jgi:hypothetical protein